MSNFDTTGIQLNLPVYPDHVLQIIQSLTWTGTYGDVDFFRKGRTNFGASAFSTTSHVEMHDYNGNDPLSIIASSAETFKVDAAGKTTIQNAAITSLTASSANVTGLTATNVKITGSLQGTATTATTASYVLGSDVHGTVTSASYALTASYAMNGGNTTTPGGNDGDIQYNDGGALGGVSKLTFDGTNLTATGSFQGSLAGTATTASYVNLVAGPGITVNKLQITASVRSVNGNFPNSSGNITTALSAVVTGTSASFDSSGSGDVTASLADGLIFIIANDPTPSYNGDVYIFNSGSEGQWYPIAPLDQAATDALYLRLDGTNSPMTGDFDLGGYSITNGLNFEGTASWAESASWAPGIDASAFITTGSNTAKQGVTGSLVVSGSFVVTSSAYTYVSMSEGSIVTTNVVGGGKVGSFLSPFYDQYDTNFAMYPYLHTYFNNSGMNGFGGKSYYYHDSALGYEYYDENTGELRAPMMYFIKDWQTSGPNVRIYTIISDNVSTEIQYLQGWQPGGGNVRIYEKNGRKHVLTVTGSFLALDGTSLGTDLTNKHFITGSVSATGSITLGGILAIQPYTGSFSGDSPQSISTDTQQIAAGVLTAGGSDLFTGSFGNRYLPQGYQVYDVFFNENINGTNTIRLWAPGNNSNTKTVKHKGPITIIGQYNSQTTAISASSYGLGTVGSEEWVTLYHNSVNNIWNVQSRGRKGETVISSGKTGALQTITGSLGITGSLTLNGASVTDNLRYVALLTYDGTNVTANVLENTIGTTINWTVPTTGVARGTAASGTPFTAGKTWISNGSYNNGGLPYIVTSRPRGAFPTTAVDYTFFLHDGTVSSTPLFTDFPVEIRVYK